MIPRLIDEAREAMSPSRPLTLEEMTRLAHLIANKHKESDEEQEERMKLQILYERFLNDTNLPTEEVESKEQLLEKIRNRKQSQERVRGLLRYSWTIGLALLIAGMVFSEHRPFLLWLSTLALRVQITEGLIFGGGFTTQRILSILSVEMAYPLYRWLASPQVPFSHGMVYGTLASAIVLWLAVLFITLDTYRPTPPPKKAKNKSKAPGNKKRKRS